MKKKEAWDKFKESGKIKDYLVYAEAKRSESCYDNKSRGNNCR